jgi:hypothetical protein
MGGDGIGAQGVKRGDPAATGRGVTVPDCLSAGHARDSG